MNCTIDQTKNEAGAGVRGENASMGSSFPDPPVRLCVGVGGTQPGSACRAGIPSMGCVRGYLAKIIGKAVRRDRSGRVIWVSSPLHAAPALSRQ
jgi:hypothetical protein